MIGTKLHSFGGSGYAGEMDTQYASKGEYVQVEMKLRTTKTETVVVSLPRMEAEATQKSLY